MELRETHKCISQNFENDFLASLKDGRLKKQMRSNISFSVIVQPFVQNTARVQ